MNEEVYDTVIIGSGPAGLTAAIYNVRAALKTVVITGNQPGGQLTITTMVENFPGFTNGIGGMKLMMDMMSQYKNLGGEIKQGLVKEIRATINDKQQFEVILDSGDIVVTKAVIVATGAGARWLEIPKEKEMIGKGVSGCATCDGIFFRDKIVAITGGGDTACEEAAFLAKFTKKVYMIHRRDQLRAQVPQQKLVLNNEKIELVWNSEVAEIVGESKVEGLKIKNNKTGEEKILEVEGLFVAIGRIPATDFVKNLVEVAEEGQIVTGKNADFMTMTSVPGIFAAGDCVNTKHRQAIVAAGDGARAGLEAEMWIANNRN